MSGEPQNAEWRMTEETLPERPGAGPWPQLCIALALLPLSVVILAIELESDIIQSSPQPKLIGLLVVPPLLAITGVLWALVIVVLHFWRRHR
jgi:hypothetical protein